MNMETARFGEISFSEEDVLRFETGLVGFPLLREFVLVEHKPGHPFQWLQSLDDGLTAFLVVNPNVYLSDYSPEISDEDAECLGLEGEGTAAAVLTTVSIPAGQPGEMTINLAAPLVVNAITRTAKQVVLESDAYTMRHRVFPPAEKDEALAA